MAWSDSVLGFMGLGKTQYKTPQEASYFGGERSAGGDYEQARREAEAAWAGQRNYEGQPLGAIDRSMSDLDYARQSQLANLVLDAAQGRGPSAAQAQLQAGMDQAIANQYAQAASARSSLGAAAAARQAGMSAAQIQQQTANEAAALRAREQQAAMGLAGDLTSQMRGQSLSQAQADAAYRQQQIEANRDATFRERQLAAQREQAANERAQGIAQMQTTARTQGAGGALGATAQSEQGSKDTWGKILGGALGAGAGALIGLSDRRAKTNISDASDEIDAWLETLEPYRYEYRDKPGDVFSGIMAQDMEKSVVGRDMIQEDSEGLKRIDPRKALFAALAGLGELTNRVAALEGKKRNA